MIKWFGDKVKVTVNKFGVTLGMKSDVFSCIMSCFVWLTSI